jgi:hypothetical protein
MRPILLTSTLALALSALAASAAAQPATSTPPAQPEGKKDEKKDEAKPEEKKDEAKPEEKDEPPAVEGAGQLQETDTHDPLWVGAYWTVGFGKTDVVEQKLPGTLQTEPQNILTRAGIWTQTFELAARYDFGKTLGIGARFPFTYGNVDRITYGGAHAFTIGNFELEARYTKEVSEKATVRVGMTVALPTALGTDLPATQQELDRTPGSRYNLADAYRFTINQSAAAAYGYERNDLFWSRRFAFVPHGEVVFTSGKLRLTPYLRLPIFVDTHADSVEPGRFEVVAGARATYRVTDWLEAGLRAWAYVPVARRGASPDPAGVASPELRFLFGEKRSTVLGVSGVLPFVGSLVTPDYWASVRATVSATF